MGLLKESLTWSLLISLVLAAGTQPHDSEHPSMSSAAFGPEGPPMPPPHILEMMEAAAAAAGQHHQGTEMAAAGQRHHSMKPRRPRSRVSALCSLFQTFLDARMSACRVSLPPRLGEEEARPDLDTNALVQIQGDSGSMNRMDRLRDGSEEDENEDDDSQHHDHDETKILRDKTTIIVPERPCPQGQRRDPGGYCRTVLRIRPYYGQQLSARPIKYYYRRYMTQRYVAVPTLHFILPH